MIDNAMQPRAESPGSKHHFSIGRVSLCLLPLLVLALWVLAFSGLATAGGTATAGSPARMSVQVPASAKSAGVAMLDVSIAVLRKPASGQLGAVVRFKRPGGSMAEVGRVSIVSGEQSYQFNVGPLSGGGPAEIEVSLLDRGGGPVPAGAALSIGRAQIVMR